MCAGPFEGYSVVRASITNAEQLDVIGSWELDVWSRESTLALGLNDIRVHTEHVEQLNRMGIQFDVLIPDMDAHTEAAQRDLEESRGSDAALVDFFTAYHTYDEIAAYLVNLTTTYSSISTFVKSIGTTIQGRDIFAVIITGKGTGEKKKLFFSGGQHAREWVAPATSLYLINNLVSQYGSNGNITGLLDRSIIYFVPLVNPDGYVFSWSSSANRLWRKNRRANSGGSYGVDLNRNWNDHWGGAGSSGTPTSDTYRGTAAFSEPESKAVSDWVNANGPFYGAIDYHSYSQLILRPYGWTTTLPPNNALATTVGNGIRTKILAVNGVSYTSEASWELYYTTGTAQDWYYSEAKVPLSYTIELRDTGTYGFQLPASQIKPTGAENWAGFVYFIQAVLANTN